MKAEWQDPKKENNSRRKTYGKGKDNDEKTLDRRRNLGLVSGKTLDQRM